MGGVRGRRVEKGVLGDESGGLLSGSDSGSLNVPAGPVFYPTEEEFKDPLEYIYKIRPEAEPYGICKIVPPESWKPPFALDMELFTFGTKTQAIHQLQARCPPCDPKTFRLEYSRFLEEHCGKKARKRIVFEGQDLDLCKLFNAVKRFGGYDNVAKMKKWGDVFRFMRPGVKISACSKHVLAQLYLEHLIEYEEHYCQLNKGKAKSCKRGISGLKKCEPEVEASSVKRRRKNKEGDRVEIKKVEVKERDQICEQCKSGLHGDVMLLCDRCDKGWHTYCLSPPLKAIPPGNWYCLECLNSEKDSFGFVPGKQFSLEAFRRVADRVKKKWFGSGAISWVQVEKRFWEIVEGSVGEVEVMYGSDLDTSSYGSGFPRQIDQRPPSVDIDIWNEYCGSPWNLNNLPRLKGSMLQTVHHNIAGVMVPWLYLGMMFSAFCWHFEDHCFYSMNYHHWGEPKCWYSVPGNEADAFEKVMRDSLPDLFEAQPDLLFQLVTMLNPSVLQEKGVPVYSIIQEPGNFVITFPRSYHGGFNLGLNCAEAVNFAPADWLPHGGFGAELYRLYHKVPVLSHEELLCVVAKGEFDSRASAYLKEELVRIYNNEKTWRERLWKNGIIRSSPMTPRLKPDYVGTEEDPMCIICQQLLYLSAVSCNCRPSTYVCLEHWEHLCECKPNKHRLLYRHTLAELTSLLHEVDRNYHVEAADDQKTMCSEKRVALAKKVKNGHFTHLQLAEEWILRSCKILEDPYSRQSYVKAIEEAEEFLWAGSEMDLVRDVHANLIQARKWARSVRNCVSKLKMWSNKPQCDSERVEMDHVNELLKFNTPPCYEPRHIQLKEFREKANKLIQEIKSALTLWSEFSLDDLEILHLKAVDLPIHIKDSDELNLKLFTVKDWVENVRNCLSQKAPSSVDVDVLYKLQAEKLEIQLQLPEADKLNDLIRQVESCRSGCVQILKDLDSLKEIKQFLGEWEDFTVTVPELELLRKYYSDTISWMSRFDLALTNVQEREDQGTVVDDLTCIQKDGLLLKIRVDKLPRVEFELNRARCRVKAYEVLRGKMSMDFVQQLMSEATTLQIEKEKLFVDISQRHSGAVCWEEKAQVLLATKAPLSEFQDILRASEEISIIPPSLPQVKLAVSTAKEWLLKCKPFLFQDSSSLPISNSCLKVGILKELVLESEDLKVHLEECSLLERVLEKGIEWEQESSSILKDTEKLWHVNIIGEGGAASSLVPRLEHHVLLIETAVVAGVSLGLELSMIPKLRDVYSTLKWCIRVISFSSREPTQKEVEMMLEDADNLPGTYKSSSLWTSLFDGLQWLSTSIEILDPNHHWQFEVSSVDKHLLLSESLHMSFPLIIGRLRDSVQNHNLWLEQVNLFFGLSLQDRSWNSFLQLKEDGALNAFSCVELQKVLVEFENCQKWQERCAEIVKPSIGEKNPLLSALTQLKNTLEGSLDILINHKNGVSRNVCVCCISAVEDLAILTCSICKDCFHLHCTETLLVDAVSFVCKYCDFVNSAKLPRGGCSALKTGKKPIALDELRVLSDANDLCLRMEEWQILDQIVSKAHDFNACLMELVDFALSYTSKDLDVVKQKLCIALKAMSISGICHDEGASHKFELALARNSWKIRADKLLQSAEKPMLQQIQHHLHEGLVMKIPPEDYFTQRLTEMRDMGLQWIDTAKQVSMDGGLLGLDRVFALISEGECLPVSCEKELKLLRDRSMLYCICRRPYDKRAMIACDKCDEWYHFDCIKISSAPKVYICPACNPCSSGDTHPTDLALTAQDRCSAEEPHTPLRRSELRRNSSPKPKSTSKKILEEMEMNDNSPERNFSNVERLLWRQRKPFRRVARKRSELQSLSPFFHLQQQLQNNK